MVVDTTLLELYDKHVFYSVISNYWTAYSLGLIKKTRTVSETLLLAGLEKLTNVLSFKSGLFGEDFEFIMDVFLVVLDPVLDVGFWFEE